MFAGIPIAGLLVAPAAWGIIVIAALSLVSLAVLGAVGGHLGGAPLGRASLRVIVGGALAMVVTAVVGGLVCRPRYALTERARRDTPASHPQKYASFGITAETHGAVNIGIANTPLIVNVSLGYVFQ